MKDYKKILSMYDTIESAEPDISTERLLQQTADACKVTVDEVVDALYYEAQDIKELGD